MIVTHAVESIIGYLIYLEALELVSGHVVEGYAHVTLKELVSVKSYLIDVAPQIGHLTVLIL